MLDLSSLEELIARVAAIDFSNSEHDTREIAVNRIIDALGWDTMKPDEGAREFSVRGGKVDYCLRGQRRNLVLIEVKRAGTDLADHQEQLLRYAFDEGVPLAVLTDGLDWWLYLPMVGGSWEQRRFSRTNLRAQQPADAAYALHRFLNRDSLIGGQALEEATREFESQERDRLVRGALQEAWVQVLSDPHGLLPDLLAEAVNEISGHAPDRETIAEFLQGISGSGGTEGGSPVPSERSKVHYPPKHEPERSVSTKARKRKATKKMSTRVEGSGSRDHLLVKFEDGKMKRWKLPDRSDKAAIRIVRDAAEAFAGDHGATDGQINAVKKSLTTAKYYVGRPKRSLN